ncbi:GNAT family N-acetyltransferase [Aurantivibrio plasticivorans]
MNIVRVDYNNPQHAADLLLLLDHYARDPMGGGQPLNEWTKSNLVTALSQRHDAISLLGYIDDQPVALLNAFEGFSTFKCQPLINIHDVVVLNQFRGKHLAALMFNALEVIADERNCCKLTLEVLSANTSAQRLYQRLGFTAYELDPQAGQALFWEKSLTEK